MNENVREGEVYELNGNKSRVSGVKFNYFDGKKCNKL
jgi:hypothetical protein